MDTVIGSRPLPGWLQAVLPASLTGSATMLLALAAALLVLPAILGALLDMATYLLQTYVVKAIGTSDLLARRRARPSVPRPVSNLAGDQLWPEPAAL